MPKLQSLNPEELVFARLACSKLAKNLQGVLSIGFQSLVSGAPDPKQWFSYRFHRLCALAVVLESVVIEPPAQETVRHLKQYSGDLDAALCRLQEESLAIAPLLPGTTEQVLSSLRASTIKVYDLLQACATFLGVDLPEITKSREASLLVLDALPATSDSYRATVAAAKSS